MTRIAAVLLIVCSHAAPLAAQEAAELRGQQAEARGLFEAARAAFADARYEDALGYFQRAYELSHRAALLYNIGVCADRLRRDDVALAAFEQYLAESPLDAPQRADAEVRVRVLTGQRPLEREVEIAPLPGHAGPSLAPIGWGTLIGGAVVLAGGVVLLAVGQLEADAVANAGEGTTWPDVRGAAVNAEWMRTFGWVLAGVGAAATALGIALVAVDTGSGRASMELTPDGVRLGWRSTWNP